MASTSYIQLIDKIQAFCDAHYQIERFDAEFGEQRPNLATDSEKYPYVFLEPTSVDGGYDLRNFSVTITCYDIIQKDRDNLNTIVSDCEQILQDLFAYFNQGKDEDVIALSNSKAPLNNFDSDYVAGWSMNIVFELEGWCTNAIPMSPITPGGSLCADADVDNSDASYSATVASGGSLTVPDSTLNFNGSSEGSVVSVKTIDIDLEDGAGNPVTPDATTLVGNTLTIDVTPCSGGGNSAPLNKTGQTTSYRTGDDGDLEAGKNTNFTTLSWTNPAGNTNRFTDDTGAQTFTNEIMVDWSTYDEANDAVTAYYLGDDTARNWNSFIDWAVALSTGGHSDWRPINVMEMLNLYNWTTDSGTASTDWSPANTMSHNMTSGGRYKWTSTTYKLNTTRAHATDTATWLLLTGAGGKTGAYRCIAVREYTLAELGL